MTPASLKEYDTEELALLGEEMYRFASELYPICRSITGEGIRQTLAKIGERIPVAVSEVPTGTKVYDWTVPREWNIQDAYIKNLRGERVVDFQRLNLHVMSYSAPVHATLSLTELRPHLHTLPDHPEWVPYRTSYYSEDWGFCLAHKQMLALEDTEYEVCIDSSLKEGSLAYGECYLPGQSTEEVLISCHACHPSLANDNLSGLAVATALAASLADRELRYSYRFLFIPGTIGAITWLARNSDVAARVRHGLVLTCVGDAGGFHYKKSRRGSSEMDRTMGHVLRHSGEQFEILEFSPYGYDERQYCSPGFDLPVGCLMRSTWGSFPEYHTSADNLDFIHPQQLARTLRVCLSVCDALESNGYYLNQNPFCEPQLGKRNLYRSTGGETIEAEVNALLWVLNQSDGQRSLLDVAERSGLAFASIAKAAKLLQDHGLLTETKCVPSAEEKQSSRNLKDG